jgi:hypothetical protein
MQYARMLQQLQSLRTLLSGRAVSYCATRLRAAGKGWWIRWLLCKTESDRVTVKSLSMQGAPC